MLFQEPMESSARTEYRVTFPDSYPAGCSIEGRQGHYSVAPSPEAAAVRVARRENAFNATVDVQPWKLVDDDGDRTNLPNEARRQANRVTVRDGKVTACTPFLVLASK